MRKYWYLVLMALVTVPLFAMPAAAWEFNLSGALNFEQEVLGQGSNHFFGPHDVANTGAAVQAHRVNFWPGFQTPNTPIASMGQCVSSSDARWRTQYAEFFPVIKINKALSIHGSYYVGSWDDPLINPGQGIPWDSEYVVKQSTGAHTSMAPGSWNWMRIKCKLPWGSLSLGKRPSAWGMGLTYEEYTAGSNSVSLSVPYGPLTIGFSVYPGRRSNHGQAFSNDDDGSNTREVNWAWGVDYSSAMVKTGFAVGHTERSRPAERYLTITADDETRYRHDLELKYYLKYNNGRFFANAEIDYYDRRVEELGDQTFGQQYVEALVYGAEAGVYAGPAKFTLFAFNGTDNDRRHGVVIKEGNFFSLSGDFGNSYTVCYPYTYIMGFHYGGGNAWGRDYVSGIGNGRGRWTSGLLLAARVDYAVAANLNIYGSVAHATQWNKSFGWGYIGIADGTGDDGLGLVTMSVKGTLANPSPAIPDDDMGWEYGTGVDWKLLEGLTLRVKAHYWQPGNWWKYACVSKTNSNWANPANDTTLWGTNPDRNIDAVYGYNVMLTADF